mgnify:CR=1 FL=1
MRYGNPNKFLPNYVGKKWEATDLNFSAELNDNQIEPANALLLSCRENGGGILKAATGLGAITGGIQPTASGLQTPLTRGAVTLEGAMPLNPTFTEQMGLQTLATQAAQAAPPLRKPPP